VGLAGRDGRLDPDARPHRRRARLLGTQAPLPDRLRTGGEVWFLHLSGDRELLAERLRARTGHFMKVALLDTQLADLEPLEPDEPGHTVDLAEPPERLVEQALAALAHSSS